MVKLKRTLALSCLIFLLISSAACQDSHSSGTELTVGSSEIEERMNIYPQFKLTPPAAILIGNVNSKGEFNNILLTIIPSDPDYRSIYESIEQKWFRPEEKNVLAKVLSNMDSLIDDSTYLVCFKYDEPFIWTEAYAPDDIKKFYLHYLVFLPFGDPTDKSVSYMAISENTQFYNQLNVYVFEYDKTFSKTIERVFDHEGIAYQ
ncbi:MAG: hypothetical protein VB070_07055 [Clostridiaceae bacterium]|nr:hypothetical protein [Clostridiaceae bacterium]